MAFNLSKLKEAGMNNKCVKFLYKGPNDLNYKWTGLISMMSITNYYKYKQYRTSYVYIWGVEEYDLADFIKSYRSDKIKDVIISNFSDIDDYIFQWFYRKFKLKDYNHSRFFYDVK